MKYINPKPLWDERIKGSSDENSNTSSTNLKDIQFSIDTENHRGKTCLLLDEKNISIFSDLQLCSILDMIIYETPKQNEKNIQPILENNEIQEFDYIDILFQLFGFESSTNNIKNRQNFVKLILPFLKEPDFKNYIVKRLDYKKSFYSWINAKFERKKFKDIENFMKFEEVNCLEENNVMNDEAFQLFNNVGVSLNIKFTNVYIQENTIKAFDLGDTNASNRIFVGLYKDGEEIHFFMPLLSYKNKENSQLILEYKNNAQINKYIFPPNYGPIYLQKTDSSISIPYFQIFCERSGYDIPGKDIKSLNPFLNNDFPIFIKYYKKDLDPLKVSSLIKLRFQIQNILLNDEKVRITNYNDKLDDVCKIICENIFKIPEDNFTKEDDGIEFNINGKSISLKDKTYDDICTNNQYLLHLMTPNDFIPAIPCAKISSPFELLNVAVNSLSNIFFIAKSQKTKANKINIYFGNGDFGSSNLVDMIWPKIIKTDQPISTFIISCEIAFTQGDIYCLPPGIIILHKIGDDKIITHYSRTKHIWTKEKQFKVSPEINDEASVFFYKSQYIILYKNANGRFEGKSYSYIKKTDSKRDDAPPAEELDDENKFDEVDESSIELGVDDLESVHFTNNRIYFVKRDKKSIVDYKSLINKRDVKKDENEKNRIDDLLIMENKEKRLELEVSMDESIFKYTPSPIAIEINQKLHILKVNEEKISSILYHPANKNSMLYYSILSMFYRYRRHFDHVFNSSKKKGTCIIHVSIDCSYNGDFNSFFESSSSPGIYTNFVNNLSKRVIKSNDKNESMNEKLMYPKNWTELPNIIYLYFHNGKLQTGLTERRTLCQLAAAFACSYAISVYTSTGKVVCYEPPDQNAVIWTEERCRNMEKNLVATYGTLLEMKNDYEFEFALSVLEPTKNLIPDFKKFLYSVSTQ